MKLKDIFKYSGSSIKTQKGRSSLTILGVVIGIAAIVALNSMTAGLEATITGQLEEGLSANILTVSPGGGFFGGSGTVTPIFLNDTQELEKIDHIDVALAIMQTTTSYYVDNETNGTTNVFGVDFEKYGELFSTFAIGDEGSGTIPTDNESFVIGNNIQFVSGSEFFNTGDNLTIMWSIRNETTLSYDYFNYTAMISGILGEIGSVSISGGPSDNGIYLHIDKFIEIFDQTEVNSIIVLIDDSSDAVIDQVSKDIENYFGEGVSVLSSTSLLDTMGNVLGTISIFLTAIAAISLVVAGIGIMNIMTVSIMERTREIGILKALGAKDKTVLSFFLVEALLIGLIGSLIGLGVGYLGANGLGFILGGFGGETTSGPAGFGGNIGMAIAPILSPTLVFQAIFFGVLVAIVFGLYPAWKASKKPPVEALRYE